MKKIKKYFVLVLVFFAISINCLHSITAKVDKRVELMSIVARISGFEEYVNNSLKEYVHDIDSFFEPYANMPLILFTKEIRETHRIAYGDVTSFALSLEVANGEIRFISEKEKFERLEQGDYHWNVEISKKYLKLLNEFYKKTNFELFYERHAGLYKITEDRYNSSISNSLDLDWFQDIFDRNDMSFNIVLGLCNGTHCYGGIALLNENEYGRFATVGISMVDSEYIPHFPSAYKRREVSTVIHEFSHSFCHEPIQKYESLMREPFEQIVPFLDKLINPVYGDSHRTVMGENLVRLTTVLYFKSHKEFESDMNFILYHEESQGFIWMTKLLFFYNNFLNNRETYPNFQSFIPEYVLFMGDIAKNIKSELSDFQNRYPQIVFVFPINGSVVESDIKEIRVLFNKPMHNAMGVRAIKNDNIVSVFKHRNKEQEAYWSEDSLEYIIPVDLKPNTNYGTVLTTFFHAKSNFPLKEDCEWSFSTK